MKFSKEVLFAKINLNNEKQIIKLKKLKEILKEWFKVNLYVLKIGFLHKLI